ncbi:MAG: hypothetical protein ACI9UA_005229 [Pseudoalteromonas tetraodonis]
MAQFRQRTTLRDGREASSALKAEGVELREIVQRVAPRGSQQLDMLEVRPVDQRLHDLRADPPAGNGDHTEHLEVFERIDSGEVEVFVGTPMQDLKVLGTLGSIRYCLCHEDDRGRFGTCLDEELEMQLKLALDAGAGLDEFFCVSEGNPVSRVGREQEPSDWAGVASFGADPHQAGFFVFGIVSERPHRSRKRKS